MPVEAGYVTLPVADLAKAEKFFGSLFGWEFDDGHIHNTNLPMGLDPRAGVGGNCSNIYFKVADIDAYLKRVEALGGKVLQQNDSKSGRNAVCRDDQRTEFSLWQPAPGYD